MNINDDVLNMQKGWVVCYEDGSIITEYLSDGTVNDWRKVPKKGIKSLSLKWNAKSWTITGKEVYLQKKRGWVNPSSTMVEPTVQYRYIGYWEGSKKVFYRVDDVTGEMSMVIEE